MAPLLPLIQVPKSFIVSFSVAIFFYLTRLKDGSAQAPVDGINLDINITTFKSSQLDGLVITLVSTGGLLVIVWMALTILFGRNPNVRQKGIIFIITGLIGAALMIISPFFYIQVNSSIVCHWRIWLQLMGLSLVLVAISSRELLLKIVFASRTKFKNAKRWLIQRDLFLFSTILILFEVILLVLYSSHTTYSLTEVYTVDGYKMMVCEPKESTSSKSHYFSSSLFAFNSLQVTLALVLGIMNRTAT
jgi:hypothetical protein